jgi:hypothetical protein
MCFAELLCFFKFFWQVTKVHHHSFSPSGITTEKETWEAELVFLTSQAHSQLCL